MSLLSIVMAIGHAIKNKNATFVVKAQTNLGIEGDNVKNILSPHKGGYIVIQWND